MRPQVKEYLNKFVDQFEQLNFDIDSLILFGSQAKGTAILSSDIDIAVVMDKHLSPQERGTLRDLGDEIDMRIKLDLFFTTQQALSNATDIFNTNKYIRDEGVVLWQR